MNRWVIAMAASSIILGLGMSVMAQQPPHAPEAVTKALKAEWPDGIFRGVDQGSNYPGWEPKKIWRTQVSVNRDEKTSTFSVCLSDAGQVIRVTSNFGGVSAAPGAPQVVADAVAAAIPGGQCDFGARIELRVDKTGALLPSPGVTYLMQASGTECIALLSISEDGKDTKVLWRTPPAVFKMVKAELPGAVMMEPAAISTVPASNRAWGAKTMGRPGVDRVKRVVIMETGEISEIMTDFKRQPDQAPSEIPAAVVSAVAAYSGGKNEFPVPWRKTDKYMDEMMNQLPAPVVTYSYSSSYGIVSLTETGAVVTIVHHQIRADDLPAAVKDAASAAFSGGVISSVFEKKETRANENTLAPLTKPVVTYHLRIGNPYLGSLTVTEAGITLSLRRRLDVEALPAAVAQAAEEAVPGGVIESASRSEKRLDGNFVPLAQPEIKYGVSVTFEGALVNLTLDGDGKVIRRNDQLAEQWMLPAR